MGKMRIKARTRTPEEKNYEIIISYAPENFKNSFSGMTENNQLEKICMGIYRKLRELKGNI